MLTAGGSAAFAFVSLNDKVIIEISSPGKDEMNIDYRDVPTLPDAEAAAVADETSLAAAGSMVVMPAEETEPRLFMARMSFGVPWGWQVHARPEESVISLMRPDGGAEIIVLLWPQPRPLPSQGVERLEFVTVAGAPAQRYRQKTPDGEIEHIFFEDSYADGSRISISYRAMGEPIEDGAAIFELFLADLTLEDSPPGGWVPYGPPQARAADPFEGLDLADFEVR